MAAFGIMLIALPTVVYKIVNSILSSVPDYKDDQDNRFILMGACHEIGIIFYGLGLLFILCNFDWLKIWLAPKLYLLEYAASLVK